MDQAVQGAMAEQAAQGVMAEQGAMVEQAVQGAMAEQGAQGAMVEQAVVEQAHGGIASVALASTLGPAPTAIQPPQKNSLGEISGSLAGTGSGLD